LSKKSWSISITPTNTLQKNSSADKKSLEAIAFNCLTTLISYLSYFIILAFSTWLVLSGDFTAGNFFVAIGMIDQLSYPMISLSGILRMLFSIKPTCNDLQEFVKIPFSQEVARELTSLRESLSSKMSNSPMTGSDPS